MDKIKVLWMNNGDESLLDYIELGNNYQIDITPCKCMTDCRHLLNDLCTKWDAVILNAEVKNLPNEKPNTNNLYKAANDVKDKNIPWFVVITKELRNKAMILGVLPKDERYYNIQTEYKELFDVVRIKVSNNPKNRVLEKYADVIRFCPEKGLIDMLIKLECFDVQADVTILNECRKILEWIIKHTLFTEMQISDAILKELINHYKKNDKRLPHTETYGDLSLNDFSYAVGRSPNVPIYVQRSLFACVSIVNPGSHKTDIDTVIRSNMAPYVIKSIIYDLLNILYWCASLNVKSYKL